MTMGLLIIVVAIAIAAVLVWLGRARRARPTSPEDRYRRDIQGLRPRARALSAKVSTEELWSAGATPSPSIRAPRRPAPCSRQVDLRMRRLRWLGCGG